MSSPTRETKQGESVAVASAPDCEVHSQSGETVPAEFDVSTFEGPWRYLCLECAYLFGPERPEGDPEAGKSPRLGTGLGQRLVVRKGAKPAPKAEPWSTEASRPEAKKRATAVSGAAVKADSQEAEPEHPEPDTFKGQKLGEPVLTVVVPEGPPITQVDPAEMRAQSERDAAELAAMDQAEAEAKKEGDGGSEG